MENPCSRQQTPDLRQTVEITVYSNSGALAALVEVNSQCSVTLKSERNDRTQDQRTQLEREQGVIRALKPCLHPLPLYPRTAAKKISPAHLLLLGHTRDQQQLGNTNGFIEAQSACPRAAFRLSV